MIYKIKNIHVCSLSTLNSISYSTCIEELYDFLLKFTNKIRCGMVQEIDCFSLLS